MCAGFAQGLRRVCAGFAQGVRNTHKHIQNTPRTQGGSRQIRAGVCQKNWRKTNGIAIETVRIFMLGEWVVSYICGVDVNDDVISGIESIRS